MSDIRFLITGTTGATGSAAAAQLLDKGQRVRAFVHREDERSESLGRRGAEVVVGDLLDFDAVREALKGVNRAYFVYPIRPGLVQATAQFAQSALEACRISWLRTEKPSRRRALWGDAVVAGLGQVSSVGTVNGVQQGPLSGVIGA